MAGTSNAGGNWRMTTQIAMVLNVTKIQLNGDEGWTELQKDGITVTELMAHLTADTSEQRMNLNPLL